MSQKYFLTQREPRGFIHYIEKTLSPMVHNFLGSRDLIDLTKIMFPLPRKMHTGTNHSILPTFSGIS